MKKVYNNNQNKNCWVNVPQKKKEKRGVAFWVLFVLIILWTVGSVLGTFAFIENRDTQRYSASADEVTGTESYTLRTNNIFFPSNRISLDGVLGRPNPDTYINSLTGTATFTITQNGDIYNISHSIAAGTGYWLDAYTIPYSTNTLTKLGRTIHFDASTARGNETYYFTLTPTTYFYVTMQIGIDVGYDIGTTYSFTYSSWEVERYDNYEVHNLLTFIDGSNKRLNFGFVWYTPVSAGHGWASMYRWTDRTYYMATDFTDNEYFVLGKKEGYIQGKNEYINSGYDDGYKNGFSEGKTAGYNEGVQDANDYSFLGLFTAVVDAPIQALSSLFNFEILGVNLLSFVTAVFTVCIIILIVKLVFNGGGD